MVIIDKPKFFVSIRNQQYPVYDLPGKTHGENDSTLWIKYNSYPIFDEIAFIPYVEKKCKKNLWDISIREDNSISNEILNTHIFVTLKVNNKEIYNFYAKSLDSAYHDAKERIKQLEKNLSSFDFDKLKDKKIYYKGQPAKIDLGYFTDGTIVISPDCDEIDLDKWWNGLKEPWFELKDLDELKSNKNKNRLSVDVLDKNIYWFRNDRRSKLIKIIGKVKG